MSKICWKCGRPHKDGDAFCMYCGASFATEDMKYQTDGRTVSATDDKAYLSTPPPKYKKRRTGIVVAVVAIVAVVLVAILLVGASNSADVLYDDECTGIGKKAGTDQWVVGYDITVTNNTDHAINSDEILFKLRIDGQVIEPYAKSSQIIVSKGTVQIECVFDIDESQVSKKMEIVAYSELTVRHA